MENVIQSKYAGWLEELIREIVEREPEIIAAVFTGKDGLTYTHYYGDCMPTDKAVMAHWVNSDAMMDTVFANAGLIMDAAMEEEQCPDIDVEADEFNDEQMRYSS